MKVAVVGSRSWKNKQQVHEMLSEYEITELVSGGAIGVDSFAEEYAKKNGIPIKIFKPNYEFFGKSAPIIRNVLIVDNSDMVIGFWNGKSKGTEFTIKNALKKGLKIILYGEKHEDKR